MQAIREIKQVESNKVTINLPDAFMAKRVEVIVLLLDEDSTIKNEDRKTSFLKFKEKYHFKLPADYRFDREEVYDE